MGRALDLSWGDFQGLESLCVRGWTAAELRQLEAGRCEAVAVLPAEAGAGPAIAGMQPVAGTFVVDGGALWFRPRFPFRPGLNYVLQVRLEGGGWRAPGAERWELARPATANAPSTLVTAVHPTARELPLNLLKFYVEFSAPMSEGYARSSISLTGADGRPIDDAFAPMEPELWDPRRRRLTVLLDPGRIKRGLASHERAGYPLAAGEPVTLRVDSSFLDSRGVALAASGERTFAVGPALRKLVVPATWRLAAPARGSAEPLRVEFGRPLDHALLRHSLSVLEADGARVRGRSRPAAGDEGWHFFPAAPWRPGEYQLSVDPRLEDLAGNSVRRLFDRDITSDMPRNEGLALVPWTVE